MSKSRTIRVNISDGVVYSVEGPRGFVVDVVEEFENEGEAEMIFDKLSGDSVMCQSEDGVEVIYRLVCQ